MALYYNKKGPNGPLIYYFSSLKSCIRRAILPDRRGRVSSSRLGKVNKFTLLSLRSVG